MRSTTLDIRPISPLRLQARLQTRARWRYWRAHRKLLALIGVLALAAIGVAWRSLQAHGGALLGALHVQPGLVVAAAVALGWGLARRTRQRAEQAIATSWLATAPLSQHDVLASVRRQVAWHTTTALAAIVLLLLGAAFASGVSAWQTVVLFGLGYAAGLVAGWRAGATATAPAARPLPRLARARSAPTNAASLAALARWPFARLLADASPRAHAQLVAGLLLMLPMGIPPLTALAILALATALILAAALLQALLATIPAAADWMRAMPLPPSAFARALCLRSGAVLAAAILLAALLLCLLGASHATALAFFVVAAAWCVTTTINALAWRHRAERARGERMALLLAVLALLGSAWWLLPVALPLAWLRDLRQARRA